MTEHMDIIAGEIHISQDREYASATERLGASGLVPADIGKIVRQTDDESFYVLVNDSPLTWNRITQIGSMSLGAIDGWPSTTNGCAAVAQTEYVTNDIDLKSLDFDGAAVEYAQFSYWMPDDWDGGSITAEFLWTAATGSGTVIWGIATGSWINDDPIEQAWGAAQEVTDTLLAVDDMHYSPVTTAIAIGGTGAPGGFLQIRVHRDGVTDAHAADVKLLGVKIHYVKTS